MDNRKKDTIADASKYNREELQVCEDVRLFGQFGVRTTRVKIIADCTRDLGTAAKKITSGKEWFYTIPIEPKELIEELEQKISEKQTWTNQLK